MGGLLPLRHSDVNRIIYSTEVGAYSSVEFLGHQSLIITSDSNRLIPSIYVGRARKMTQIDRYGVPSPLDT